MSYLESKLCDNTYNYNKINPENIAYFFSQYGFYDKGVENIIKRINEQKLILNSHETDNLCIMDQVEKVNKDVRFPYPSNLLTALVYIRRISYLFMYEYGLDMLAKESELIPVMMEGLFIDYIKGSDNRIYLDTFYYHKDSGYITELKN